MKLLKRKPEPPIDTPKDTTMHMDRRDFIKIVFGTTSMVLLQGAKPLLAEEVAERPAAEPYALELDSGGYIIDAEFDYENFSPPTRREYEGWDDLSKRKRKDLIAEWEFENFSSAEIQDWLDTPMELEEFGAHEFARMGPCKTGVSLLENMSPKDAHELGLDLVDGEQPGSDFVGVRFSGDLDELNTWVARNGWNLVIKGE